jgi:hypothetical protein
MAAVVMPMLKSLQSLTARLYSADQNGAKVERGYQYGVGSLRGL